MPPQPARISFEIRYKAPRSVMTRLVVVGGPNEIGGLNLSKRKFFQNFENLMQGKFRRWRLEEEKKREEEEESDDSDSSETEEYDNDEVNGFSSKGSKISREEYRLEVLKFLEEKCVILEEDPNDERVENLWATPEPVEFTSIQPGEVFSYAYFVWNCNDNRLWEFEKFHEARVLKLPIATAGNPENHWVARAKAFGSRQCELRPARFYDNDSDSDSLTGHAVPMKQKPVAAVYDNFEDEDSDDDIF